MSNDDHDKAASERRYVLAEEASEVIKVLQKLNRFTENSIGYDNLGDLHREIGDFLAGLGLMIHAGDLSRSVIDSAAAAKAAEYRAGGRLLHQPNWLISSLQPYMASNNTNPEINYGEKSGVHLHYSAPESKFAIHDAKDTAVRGDRTAVGRVFYAESSGAFFAGFAWMENSFDALGDFPKIPMRPVEELEVPELNGLLELIDIPDAHSVNSALVYTPSQKAAVVVKLRLALIKNRESALQTSSKLEVYDKALPGQGEIELHYSVIKSTTPMRHFDVIVTWKESSDTFFFKFSEEIDLGKGETVVLFDKAQKRIEDLSIEQLLSLGKPYGKLKAVMDYVQTARFVFYISLEHKLEELVRKELQRNLPR